MKTTRKETSYTIDYRNRGKWVRSVCRHKTKELAEEHALIVRAIKYRLVKIVKTITETEKVVVIK